MGNAFSHLPIFVDEDATDTRSKNNVLLIVLVIEKPRELLNKCANVAVSVN